jgi:hypothetical protein
MAAKYMPDAQRANGNDSQAMVEAVMVELRATHIPRS